MKFQFSTTIFPVVLLPAMFEMEEASLCLRSHKFNVKIVLPNWNNFNSIETNFLLSFILIWKFEEDEEESATTYK